MTTGPGACGARRNDGYLSAVAAPEAIERAPASGLAAVRDQLAAHRAAGESFERAWAAVLESQPPGRRELLWFAVEAWRDAYLRRPPQPRHAVAALLEGLADTDADRGHADVLG